MSIALILLPAIAFSWILASYLRVNGRTIGGVGFIISVYCISAFVAIFLHFMEWSLASRPLEIAPTLYLIVALGVCFVALMRFKDSQFNSIVIPSIFALRIAEYVLIIGSIAALLFFSYFAILSFSGDLALNRQELAGTQEMLSRFGALNTVLSLFACLFGVNLLFAVINLVDGFGRARPSATRAWLHLIGSVSYIAYVFAYTGRDGPILWGMTFVFVFLLCGRFLSSDSLRRVKRAAILNVLIAVPLFLAITIARFGDAESGVLVSLMQYTGIQIQQFNDQFLVEAEPQWGRLYFPVFYRAFVDSTAVFDRAEWFLNYTDEGVLPWTFSTFVGSIVQDFGRFWGAIVLGLFALAVRRVYRSESRTPIGIGRLVLIVLIAQVMLFGVFYFRQGLANLQLFAFVALALVLSIRGRAPSRVLHVNSDRRGG